jgi:hypothetical protein
VARLLGRTAIDNLAQFARRQIGATYDAIAAAEGRPNATLFAEKVAPERPALEVVDWLYPNSTRIYLFRDPRDMALSILAYNRRNRLPGFGSEHAGTGIEFIDAVADAVAGMLALFEADDTAPLLVRYEDVIREPEREMTRILARCGLDASVPSVDQLLAAASRQLPEMDQHRTSPDANGSVGRWRRDLDPARQVLWTEKFSDVLGAGGYPSDMVEGT